MQIRLDRLKNFSVQGCDLDFLLIFQHDQDLITWILLSCENDSVWRLLQVRTDHIEAVVRDLEQSDLMAGVCDQKAVARLIESHTCRGMFLILRLKIDYSD